MARLARRALRFGGRCLARCDLRVRVVVLDQLDLGALEDEVDLLDVALFQLDLGEGRRHLAEGQNPSVLALKQEGLDLVQFVQLSNSHLVDVAPCAVSGRAKPYVKAYTAMSAVREHPCPR